MIFLVVEEKGRNILSFKIILCLSLKLNLRNNYILLNKYSSSCESFLVVENTELFRTINWSFFHSCEYYSFFTSRRVQATSKRKTFATLKNDLYCSKYLQMLY